MILNFSPFPVLTTDRLILRRLNDDDAQAIYDYRSSKENFPYVEMPVYRGIEDAENYILQMNTGILQNKWIVWAICLEDTIIGTVSIWNINKDARTAELGYGIFPIYRRNGYMGETIKAVIKYGFSTIELDSIEAYTGHDNLPSKAFLETMGFSHIDTIEDEYSNNMWMDIYVIKK